MSELAIEARDEAIGRVTLSNEAWMAEAFSAVLDLVSGRYTGEQIRHEVTAVIGPPRHHNAWGALIMHLVRQDILSRTSTMEHMRDLQSHGRMTPVYEKVL
jgi:hypothetical protein